MSMNSSNTNQVASNELETMLKLSELYQAGFKMDDAIVEVQRSSPSCKAYMVDVAFFCRMFTGGSTFPLLRCLDMFCKSCGHNLLIGEEMMNHLAHYDFKISGQTMVLTRFALAACILTSRKHQDGISKLIYKSDLDKLKNKDSTRKLDDMLHSLWTEAQKVSNTELAYIAFGKAAVRMTLHALSKQKIAKQESYDSFEEIVEQFQADLVSPASSTVKATSASAVSTDETSVQDLVNCSSQTVALFQNNHIKLNEKYTCPSQYEDKIFILKSIDDTGAHFEHSPLFGDPLKHCQDLASLKQWKHTKRETTQLCPPALCAQRMAYNFPSMQKEADKMYVNAILMEAYMTNKLKEDDMVSFTLHPNNLVLMKKAKKKELRFFPAGTCTAVPEKDLEKIVEKNKATLVWYKNKPFNVQPFKAVTSLEKPENGIFCPFFWAKASEEASEINLATGWVDFKQLKIPVLENPDGISPQTLLFKSTEEHLELEPPAKKAKSG
ncbi:unnamed protein product [Durusdinium trenchii]|uniref:Uncharacterized protein n=2 Tax=Durusdinium trenchii TaxID=1381693 RepID=A0ABP0P5D9_9DINO